MSHPLPSPNLQEPTQATRRTPSDPSLHERSAEPYLGLEPQETRELSVAPSGEFAHVASTNACASAPSGSSPRGRLGLLIWLLSSSRLRPMDEMIAHGRDLAFDLDLPSNPVGASSMKTGVPGTYRPVGPSCPPCPYEGSCYALFGMVNIHQRRSTTDALASAVAAAIAMVVAVRHGILARLHISGDFARDGEIDLAYIQLVVEVAGFVRARLEPSGPFLAWTYTHIAPAVFEVHRLRLDAAGISVLYSDQTVAGGAIVHRFDELLELRQQHLGLRLARCLYQLNGTQCRDCGLCWRAREENFCIVFDPYGVLRARWDDIDVSDAS